MSQKIALKLEPGRDLDVLIYSKLMQEPPIQKDGDWFMLTEKGEKRLPYYSTDRLGALELVEYMLSSQCTVELFGHEWYDGQEWCCKFGHPVPSLAAEKDKILGEGSDRVAFPEKTEASMPMAVCRAMMQFLLKAREGLKY